MKRVILLRHGETEHNTERIFQSDDARLNSRGISQIEEYVKNHQNLLAAVSEIRHSPLLRAKMSAEIIAQQISAPLVSADDFVEFINPKVIRGKSYDDSDADRVYRDWISKYMLPESMAGTGAESYYDMHIRARAVLNNLSQEDFESILIVSHSEFIRTLAAITLLSDDAPTSEIIKVMRTLKLGNARSITLEASSDGVWRVVI